MDAKDLIRALCADDPTDRRLAAEDLGEFGDRAAVPPLVGALHDPVVAVREAAARSLALLGGVDTCDALIPLLGSEDVPARNAAVEILQALATVAAPWIVCGPLASPSPDVRKFSLDVLAAAAGLDRELKEAVVDSVLRLLDDGDANVATSAIDVLGRLGGDRIIPLLVARLDGPLWFQCSVISALATIDSEASASALAAVDPARLAPSAKSFLAQAQGFAKARKKAAV